MRRDQRRMRAEAKQRQSKPAEFRAMNEKIREPELAGGERSFIESARNECTW